MKGDTDQYDLTYLSLGAGEQSTAMLICSVLGLHNVPKAASAIFADTKEEISDTYAHLERLRKWSSIPIHSATKGSLRVGCLEGGIHSTKPFVNIPAFILRPDGKIGIGSRQCTFKYKIEVISKEVRQLLGLKRGERAKGKIKVRCMIGISLDEVDRMKPSRYGWIENVFPLVEARLTRQDCARINEEHGFHKVGKSACRFCPYHDNGYWAWLQRDRPEEFSQAVDFDHAIRNMSPNGKQFIHPSCEPLDKVDFDDKKQLRLAGFGNDCEGHCGV